MKQTVRFTQYIVANILQFETQMKNKALEIYNVLVADKTKKINLAKINDKYLLKSHSYLKGKNLRKIVDSQLSATQNIFTKKKKKNQSTKYFNFI